MKYRFLTRNDLKEWDQFVDIHPQGRYMHLASYTYFLEETYGLKGYALGFYEDSELCGVLPGILIKSFTQNRKIVSMPFSDGGGMILKNNVVIKDSLLLSALDTLLKESGASHIELRGTECSGGKIPNNIFFRQSDCVKATLPLCEPSIMYKAIDYSIKKNLKRAEESSLSCENECNEQMIKSVFYPMYLEKMKEFGTPPHSLTFFLNMASLMKGRVQLFTVRFKGDIASLLWGVKTECSLQIIFILSKKEYLSYRPNDFVHWEMIKSAYSEGCLVFDFSVARYDGQRKYKEKWGTSFCDYSHYFYPHNRNYSSTPSFVKPTLPNRLWSKCIPKQLTSFIGPMIRKRLGR